MVSIDSISTLVVDWTVAYGPKILLAIVTLVVGLWIIGFIARTIEKATHKQKLDESLRHFLISLVSIGLKVVLIITVVSMLGVATSSFVAILAAAGFAVGLALQGSLSNFAGGVLILLFKPFKVGDFIEAQGFSGSVAKIEIFNTILKTPDNKTIIIPNGNLSNDAITNYSTEKTRRVDMEFGIAYENDVKKAKKLLDDVIKKDKRVLKDPAYAIVLTSLGDSSVNITVRAWVQAADYWPLKFETQETVKEVFDKNGISIPYPQMDIHMKK